MKEKPHPKRWGFFLLLNYYKKHLALIFGQTGLLIIHKAEKPPKKNFTKFFQLSNSLTFAFPNLGLVLLVDKKAEIAQLVEQLICNQ